MSYQASEIVFLSYASPDRDRVLPFYDFLLSRGFSPWMDVRQLLPGQNWEFEVTKALDSAFLIVVFVSERSVNRTGYVQKELRLALNKLQERPLSHIYVVPVILDRTVPIPQQLSDLHCLYADLPDCYDMLNRTLMHQKDQMGLAQANATRKSELKWSFGCIQERWEGIPGYDIEIDWPIYLSDRYTQIAQAGDIIKGSLLSFAASSRLVKIDQSPELFSFDQNQFIRTNLLQAKCRTPVLRGSVLSQHVVVHRYGAGAAHPNTNFATWAFLLDPLILIKSLEDCFSNPKEALMVLQSEIRPQLIRNLTRNPQFITPEEQFQVDDDWINKGTSDWSDFAAFTFEEDGLAVSFEPYQVASYADGPQFVRVPYASVVPLMKKSYADALDIRDQFDHQ